MGRRAGRQTGRLKGFSLIEMIVVIAILGILAAALSGVYRGYVRNSTNESNNERAHLAYTGFQNMVIDCEVGQNDLLFNAVKLGALDGTGSGTNDVSKWAIVTFEVSGAQLKDITVESAGSSSNGSIDMSETSSPKAYKKVSTAIKGEVSTMDDGTYRVYIDMDNYEVICAVYSERTGMTKAEANTLFQNSTYFSNKTFSAGGKDYYIMSSTDNQKAAYDNQIRVGCYPMLTAIS